MANLHLLRHAKSTWPSSSGDGHGLDDHERPLNDRGREAAKAMGRYMAKSGLCPGLVLCSSAARTRETLDIVIKELEREPKIKIEDRLYLASAGQILRRLRELPEKAEDVLLIGHNPGMHELAFRLASGSQGGNPGEGPGKSLARLHQKFPTCALASYRIGAPWKSFEAGDVELTAFVTPSDLED